MKGNSLFYLLNILFLSCCFVTLQQDIHFVAVDAGDISMAENAKNKALEIDSELLSTGGKHLFFLCFLFGVLA